MRTILSLAILAASLPAARAWDLDDNTITVTVQHAATSQPARAQLVISLLAPNDSGLDQVLAKLAGAGVTASDLTSVYSPYYPNPGAPQPPWTAWTFRRVVSFDGLKPALALLSSIRTQLPDGLGWDISFSVNSDYDTASQTCPYPALIADSRGQAASIAAAAGLRAGPIVAIADAGSAAAPGLGIPAAVIRTTGFLLSALATPYYYAPPVTTCSVTVQFKLVL